MKTKEDVLQALNDYEEQLITSEELEQALSSAPLEIIIELGL